MHDILQINEHPSAKCLTSRGMGDLGNSRRARKHHLAACTWLDREVSLRVGVRTLHNSREEGLQPLHSLGAWEEQVAKRSRIWKRYIPVLLTCAKQAHEEESIMIVKIPLC